LCRQYEKLWQISANKFGLNFVGEIERQFFLAMFDEIDSQVISHFKGNRTHKKRHHENLFLVIVAVIKSCSFTLMKILWFNSISSDPNKG
jgi:hypothetical protein